MERVEWKRSSSNLKAFLSVAAITFIILLLLLPFLPFVISIPAVGASNPVGACFTNGLVTINSPVYWANLSCTFQGSITLVGNGSFTMVNSTLVQTPGVNTTGSLSVLDTASLILNSSSITHTAGDFIVEGSSLVLNNSTVVVSRSRLASLAAQTTVILNSRIGYSNDTTTHTGNSSSTTIVNSRVSNVNVDNVYIGNPRVPSSTIAINSSTISRGGFLAGGLFLSAGGNLSVSNSVISNQVSSQNSTTSVASIAGGNVSIIGSLISSSNRGYFGYLATTTSSLRISASSLLDIAQSKISVGQSNLTGTYSSSKLLLSSQGNVSVVGSQVQSLSLHPSVLLQANSLTASSYIKLNQSLFEEGSGVGAFNISSTYGAVLDRTQIDASRSALGIECFLLYAIDSNLTTIPSSAPVFGTNVAQAYLYNTSMTARPQLSSKLGSIDIYEWLFAHVTSFSANSNSSGSSQAVPNANVNVFDAATGSVVYSSSTNGTGWAKIAVLTYASSPSGNTTKSSYIVEASHGNSWSPQVQVATSGGAFYVNLQVGPVANLGAYSLAGLTASEAAARYNLNSFTYTVLPAGYYAFGPYLLYYAPYITILSNAAPSQYRNNASSSEIDFNTLGQPSYTFYFTVIYPKNMSLIPIRAYVDGQRVPVLVESNSTHYLATFSMSSGFHKVALKFQAPNSNSNLPTGYPRFTPGRGTIIAVGILAAVAAAFLALYIRREERRK